MGTKLAKKPSEISKKVEKRLDVFFAVTATSVYEVKSDDGKGFPIAKKIALRGESRVSIGKFFRGRKMIGICKNLIFYNPERYSFSDRKFIFERKVENLSEWKGNTSFITALFKTKKEAMACFENTDLKPCDPRWVKQTMEVINAIGEDHLAFEVCRHERLALPCVL
jgi:hypothetical protein